MNRPWWREQTQFWYVKVNGKQVRLSKDKDPDGAERKGPPPDVETAWHKLAREGVPEDMRVGDLFEKFKAEIAGSDTAMASNQHLVNFEASVGKETKVSALRPYHLSNFLKTKAHWKPSTIRTCVNRVHAALNWGVREGMIEKNPISSTPGYKRQGRFERRKGLISAEHRKLAEEQSSPDFRAFLVALRETGARPSEMRRAQIEKVNLEAGFMMVPNKTAHQTGDAERKIYLSEGMKAVLRERIGDRKEGFVFLSGRGRAWKFDTLKKRWWRLQKKHGIKGSLYQYRHGFVSAAINDRNINPALVAQLVGHAGLEMLLKHYLEEDPEALKKALERITKKDDEGKETGKS